jgi:NAD(P)-dependent dehydrogenase (short-subunit alcohol dehydrogenase family)
VAGAVQVADASKPGGGWPRPVADGNEGEPVRQSRFESRVAVVTGGSNGIGRAITEALAGEGARVVICDLADSRYFAANPDVVTVSGDVAEHGLADRVIAEAVTRWGRVDILVNDAASYPDGTLLEMPPDAWDRVFRVNVTGAFMMMQAFARHCVSETGAVGAARAAPGGEAGLETAGQPAGAVVNISTGSARNPRPGGAAYSASKAAVETMSKVFAMELGRHRIRVNVVAPGYIDVREWSDAYPDRAPDDLRATLVRSIPLGRAGDPRDIAEAVLFLASDAAANITGTVLEVDGGSNAGRYMLAARDGTGHANDRG